MSQYVPGSFSFAERIMEMNVQERRHEAGSGRLLGQPKAQRHAVQRFYCAALSRLGSQLSAWGETLVERYSTETSVPARQSA
jgi:hypothetical protein